MIRKLRWGHLIALLLLAGAMVPVRAAGGIGMVDIQVIMRDYKGSAAASAAMEKFYNDATQPIRVLQKGVGLAKDDLETYKKLKEKPVADADAIKKLEDASLQNSTKYFALRDKAKKVLSTSEQQEYDQLFQQILNASAQAVIDEGTAAQLKELEQKYQEVEKKAKDSLTADEQKDYDLLHPTFKVNSIEMMRLRGDLQTKLESEQQRYEGIFAAEFDKAIAKVAKDMKLSMVVSRNVQTNQGSVEKFVLWSDDTADVTKKVVETLNANYKPELLNKKTPAPAVGPAAPAAH